MGELLGLMLGVLIGGAFGVALFGFQVLEPLQVECEKDLPRHEKCILAYIPELVTE